MTEAEYVKERLEGQLGWYEAQSRKYKLFTLTLRIIEISAAAAIPFLSTLTQLFSVGTVIASSALGVLIILCTSLASLFHAQERWMEYRTTAESLKKEKYLFQTRVEPYQEGDAFYTLVQRIETLVSKETTNWAEYMTQAAKKKAEGE